jgi:SAM-dependent methyltransferase
MSGSSSGLPERYHRPWRESFDAAIFERLRPGCAVLDIGSGRHPAIPPDRRPESTTYTGLDISMHELAEAGPGAYSETVEADATVLQQSLVGRFDLVISWQVLEHVADLESTVSNVHSYLKPGGRFVALFSGARSVFGLINRALPDRIGSRIVDRTMKRTEKNIPVFPAHYDRCTASRLDPMFTGWSEYELTPLYNGASYFDFLPPLRRAYLVYENAIHRRRVANLATHYLIVAER